MVNLSASHSWAKVYVGVRRMKTELACYEVTKYSKKLTTDYLLRKDSGDLCDSEKARPLPASLCVYLADQFGYSQSSVDLLQAIEIPQGQVELVQESSFITWRLCRRMWAQQVIWRAAKWLPAKRQTSSWAVEKLAD